MEDFAAQTKTAQGAIVITKTVVSRSLLDDALLAHQAISAARDYYDRADCEYTYLSPEEYAYDRGPFVSWDMPPGTAVIMGRVRVRRI